MDTNVLVVGAGPTGLMLANQLARRGVQTIIIDRHSGPAQQSRAMAVHARTLEIFSKLGVVDRAIQRGKPGTGINFWARGRHSARIPLEDIGRNISAFPYVLMLGQDETEIILGDKLRESGIAVQWNTELIALDQHSQHVVATLRNLDGSTRTLEVGWVAGCDGSRSAVREMCGISYPGAPYEHVFFVADTIATGDMVPDQLNAYLWREGFHLFFPMMGERRWRVIGMVPASLRGKEGVSFHDVLPHVRREAGANLRFEGCRWFSTYRIQHRSASKFREGRCFLLGDAAHIHSPMGGQGMNTGLQDAYNLAWKLAMVITGRADVVLLDSYAAERMPVAQRLLDTTDRAFNAVISDAWIAKFLRSRMIARIVALAMRSDAIRQRAFRTISQLGIRYRRSPLSRTLPGLPDSAPRAGDRFPWLRLRMSETGAVEDLMGAMDDGKFSLVVIGQSVPSGAGDAREFIGSVFEIPDDPENREELNRVGIPELCFYLVRPDGHVALAGIRLDWAKVYGYFTDQGINRG